MINLKTVVICKRFRGTDVDYNLGNKIYNCGFPEKAGGKLDWLKSFASTLPLGIFYILPDNFFQSEQHWRLLKALLKNKKLNYTKK